MTTTANALRECVERGGKFTRQQLIDWVNDKYPDRWRPSTVHTHVNACQVNNPKAYVHHPSVQKFLYRHADGSIELYVEERHGANEWAPTDDSEEPSEVVEIVESQVSLERDLEDHLVEQIGSIEEGLSFEARQASTDVGRIDILARDKNHHRVVIEIKVGDAKDASVGQIARYLGWFARTDGKPARGFLIASDFPEGVCYAASALPGLTLLRYRIAFSFERAGL